MARKGNRKVRTGCLTCKIRKVKCDEGKPACHRCVSTGRKCDGYAAAATPALRWHRPRSHLAGVGARSLQFFWEVAAPGMSGPTDPYFWTRLVLQFGSFEPAVRHALVAVSALYERLLLRGVAVEEKDGGGSVALGHYNAAIRELRKADSAPLALLVCVLFICVEFLRGDRERAVQHCHHGVRLLESVAPAYAWTREFLAPLFRRLTLFPFFFGRGRSSFPALAGAADAVPPAFAGVADAQSHADNLLRRAVRLLRRADPYRLGGQDALDTLLLRERDEIRAMLHAWEQAAAAFQWGQPESARDETVCNILMRVEIARVWTEAALERSEMVYDRYIERFRWLVDEAAKLAPRHSPVFTFEMAFVPSLFFIVIKCRDLDTRLLALSLVKKLGARKETLWELPTVYATGKLIIELEHGLLLDGAGRMCTVASCPGLPADEMRVRETTTDPELRKRTNPTTGAEEFGRTLGLFMKTADGDIYLRSEFIVETL
ncbi:hypothetical protein F4810DRAFT_686400 [Camillea tinctor]|nr:hypothetical protein F4810DRAFT_686400 [Camillea tinctor]